MSAKPTVIFILRDGRFVGVVADQSVEVMIYDPTCAEDRLYRVTEGLALSTDPAGVQAIKSGEVIGHAEDGRDHLLETGGQRRRLS